MDNELSHVGILGMRWGHRGNRNGTTSVRGKEVPVTTRKRGKEVDVIKSVRGKPVNMTEKGKAYLKEKIDKQMQKKISDLKKDRIAKGVTLATAALLFAGSVAMTNYTKRKATEGISQILLNRAARKVIHL